MNAGKIDAECPSKVAIANLTSTPHRKIPPDQTPKRRTKTNQDLVVP